MTTLHDIARRTNVSYMTVARVLTGRNKENRPSSIARAARIRRVAQEMGYRPNAAARAVTQGRFNNIVLVRSRVSDSGIVSPSLCWAIEDALAARRCRLTLHHLPDNPQTESARMNQLVGEAFADGMLIDCSQPVPPYFLQLLQKHGIPAITLNAQRPQDALRLDDFQGGMLATEHLLAQGHRRIAYLDAVNAVSAVEDGSAHYSARDRHAGYLEAMKKAALTPLTFFTQKSSASSWLADPPLDELFSPDGPTALISYGPECLLRLHTLAEVRSRRIQFVTFGDLPRALTSDIPVDAITASPAMLAETAVDLLFQKIDRPDQPLAAIAVGYELASTLPVHMQHDGMRAAARSLSICAVPQRPRPSLLTMNNDEVIARKSPAMPPQASKPADPGAYGGRPFPPPVRHDSTPATQPSPASPVAAQPAGAPADRP